MVIKNLLEKISSKYQNYHDEKIFKMLIRSIKEVGLIHHFKDIDSIIKQCYASRKVYIKHETFWQNVSIWTHDINVPRCLINNINSQQLEVLTCTYRANIINRILINDKIFDEKFFINFIMSIENCESNGAFEDRMVDLNKLFLAIKNYHTILGTKETSLIEQYSPKLDASYKTIEKYGSKKTN